jgi:hypothetical protein
MRSLLQSVACGRTSGGRHIGQCWTKVNVGNIWVGLGWLVGRIASIADDEILLGWLPNSLLDAHALGRLFTVDRLMGARIVRRDGRCIIIHALLLIAGRRDWRWKVRSDSVQGIFIQGMAQVVKARLSAVG